MNLVCLQRSILSLSVLLGTNLVAVGHSTILLAQTVPHKPQIFQTFKTSVDVSGRFSADLQADLKVDFRADAGLDAGLDRVRLEGAG